VLSKAILKLNIPILGICYGMQFIAKISGGKVIKSKEREYGFRTLKILRKSKLLAGLKNNQQIWMSHQDRIESLPKEFIITARTENSPVAVMESRYIYGVQFHPEVTHTPKGILIFKNFLFNIVGCTKDWSATKMINQIIQETKEKVKDKKIVCAVSGVVDSTIYDTSAL